jgi:predicted dienelactone hydrolase
MRKVLKIFVVILALGLVVVGFYLYRVMPRIPARPFVKPSGPYAVGTMDFDWVDSSRGEPYTRRADDKRHVPVQIWYPAVKGSGDTARYLLKPGQFSNRMGAFVARKARSNSVLDAAVAGDAMWPVLLYNHGGSWTRWSATFATEWLASQGYVVVSVEHFGFNQSNKYGDGTAFSPDTLAFPPSTGNGAQDARQSWAYLGDPVFKIWKADARFALDQLEALNRDPGPFQGKLDLTRVGAFGWSFGGALAVQLSKDDPRVVAAVDHDGQLFDDVRQTGTTRPVMLIHHGIDDALEYPEKDRAMVRELMQETESWDSTARVASTSDWYALTIAGIDHGNFSDLVLFLKQPAGRTDPRRAHEIINAYTLGFFDQYLRGKPSDLLTATASPFSEAKLEAWKK